jgi:hypothetical protein
MDHKLYVATLHKQGEHLGQLVRELNSALITLEQALDAGNSPTAPGVALLFQGFEGLERRLSLETEMLCKRLHLFLEGSKVPTDSPIKT